MIDAARDAFVALLVVSVMLSVGFGLDVRDLLRVFRRPKLLASALAFEHVAMPLAAFGVATAMGAPPSGVLAVVLCAAVPGGPISPVFVQQARGDVAFCVALVVLMAAINVFSTPLTMSAFGFGAGVDGGIALPLIRTIALYQLAPLALAMMVRTKRPALAERLGRVAEIATKSIIALLIVGLTIARWRVLVQLDPRTLAAIASTCCVAVGLGHAAAAGGPAERRTLSLTSGVRNLGLGLLVAASAFDEATLLAVMVYGLIMLVVVAPVSVWMSRRHLAADASVQ